MRAGLDQLCIDTIRTLSMDSVQQAKSGRPGTPMGLAPLVYVGTSSRGIGMRTFGASTPLEALQQKFGFQPDQVAAAAREQRGRR